jgi:hypothetical protein
MNQTKPIDTKALMEEAKTSKDKEAYKLLEKTQSHRIGIGARTNPPHPTTFFIEVIVKLSPERDEVNLPSLERTLHMLEVLQKLGYSLTYQDDNSISCEKTMSNLKIYQEYTKAKSIVSAALAVRQ